MKRHLQHREWINYSDDLFTDAVEVAGVRLAELPGGLIGAAWFDEGQRMAVVGSFSALAVIYRNLRACQP